MRRHPLYSTRRGHHRTEHHTYTAPVSETDLHIVATFTRQLLDATKPVSPTHPHPTESRPQRQTTPKQLEEREHVRSS